VRRAAGLALLLAGAAAAQGPPRSVRVARPLTAVGPFRIGVDRIYQSRSAAVTFSAPPGGGRFALVSRRTVQLQLGVFTDDPAAAAGLSTFQVSGVSALLGGRLIDLQHHGDRLETPNDTAVVRAYVYLGSVPPEVRELLAIEGQVVAYEKSTHLEIDVPLAGAALPRPVEVDGVTATVRELSVDGGTAQVTLSLQAPTLSVLMSGGSDGSYGVSLHGPEGRPAACLGGAFIQPRPNQAEYRLTFQNLRGAPTRVRVRVLHRGGARRVFPFRLERVPLALPAPGEQPGQEQRRGEAAPPRR